MNMRGVIAFALLVMLVKGVEAGGIYGSLQIDGKAVAEGTKIELRCPPPSKNQKLESPEGSSTVQKYGRYRVRVSTEGLCVFSVPEHPDAKINVISYKKATRYDLILSKKDGKYSLIRR